MLWYYATHPLDPLDKTVANINLDGVNQCGRTRDVTVGGMGASDLDDVLRTAAVSHGGDHHKPSDEIRTDWDLSGAAEDAQLMFMVGCDVANAARFPEWRPGNEFTARRDQMMKGPVGSRPFVSTRACDQRPGGLL